MKKKFRVTDIDCANCALKAERAVKKVKGVRAASLSFMTQTLNVEVDDENADAILEDVARAVKKAEPGASIR